MSRRQNCLGPKSFLYQGTLTYEIIPHKKRDFITKGATMRAGYFQPEMDSGFENPWGYGEDILKVKAAAMRLGMAE